MMTEKSHDKILLEILACINQEIDAAKKLLKTPPEESESAQTALVPDNLMSGMEEKSASVEKWFQDLPQPESASPAPKSNFLAPLDKREADFIIEKVEKINRDDEVLRRLAKVEIRVRRITLLAAMFFTFQVLTLVVVIFLMLPANYWGKLPFLSTVQESSLIKRNPIASKQEITTSKHEPDSSQPGFGISRPTPSTPKPEPSPSQQESPPAAQISAAVPQESPAVKPTAEENNPKGSEPALPPAGSSLIYVGSGTSNKYHYSECKWAKKIRPEKVVTFKSVKEAQEEGYVPCPACKPPLTD